jgi:hypothetical protein
MKLTINRLTIDIVSGKKCFHPKKSGKEKSQIQQKLLDSECALEYIAKSAKGSWSLKTK